MSEIHVVVSLYAKAGREESLRRDLIQVVEPSRREEGSLGYDLFVDMNDPRRFVFVERWASADAQNRHHTQSEHIRYFQDHGAANVESSELACFLKRVI
jgi:quinol monooxygenase YgiN